MPDPDAQTCTPDELIGKGIDKLVELRPGAMQHVNLGRGIYANVFAGWRAQAALMVRRNADFARNGRLPFSSGQGLSFLAGSEFDMPSELGPTKAIGQVALTRAAARPGGTIRKGTRFSRPADPSDQRLYGSAQCIASGDVFVRQGDVTVTVPLEASGTGSGANRPLTGVLATELEISDNIVDRAAWTVTSYEMAGGSDGVSEEELKRYARAFASGRYGPNVKAALAGALKAGARHAIAIDDPSVAALVLYVADHSWASSTRWARQIRQGLYDNKSIGFGCKVIVTGASNVVVGADVVAKVRHPSFLAETTGLDAAVQKALRTYFDDRPDWNRWRAAGLRGTVARADRRLLSSSSAVLTRPDGSVVSEPAEISTQHFMLLDSAVRVTYQSPT